MKSFLQGKKTIAAEALKPPVHFSANLAPRCNGPHAGAAASTPGASSAHVEVVKEGDKVVRLIVSCVCGERIEIECLYSPGR